MVVTWPSVNRGKPALRIPSCISGMRVESLPTPENLICATAYMSGGCSSINRFGCRSTFKLYTKLYTKVNRVSILRVQGYVIETVERGSVLDCIQEVMTIPKVLWVISDRRITSASRKCLRPDPSR